MQGLIPEAYEPLARSVFAGFTADMPATRESVVAEAVLTAAGDTPSQLRFPAGADALALVSLSSLSV